MNQPAMIRNFFDKIEKVSAAPVVKAGYQYQAPMEVEVTAPPAEAAEIPSFESFESFSMSYAATSGDDYNPDCPPLTSRKSAAARCGMNDFGVGLPPMSGSYN